MSEGLGSRLRRLLVADYGTLKMRLARRFGSTDFAGEVLHEAWLRLDRADGGGAAEVVVRNPTAYLYRLAVNIGVDQKRADSRWLAKADVDKVCREAVDEIDPARIAEARAELSTLARALEVIPPRRRAVFLASRLEGLSHKEIAERYGLTIRIVDREMKAALDHFGRVLEKKLEPRRGPRSLKTS